MTVAAVMPYFSLSTRIWIPPNYRVHLIAEANINRWIVVVPIKVLY